jgi:hypothetical protein
MKTDIKTQMDAEKADGVLTNLEAKHGLAPARCSATSNWYKSHGMYELLMSAPIHFRTRNEAFDFKPNDDFCIWLSGHMNLAFQKGYEMAKRELPNND